MACSLCVHDIYPVRLCQQHCWSYCCCFLPNAICTSKNSFLLSKKHRLRSFSKLLSVGFVSHSSCLVTSFFVKISVDSFETIACLFVLLLLGAKLKWGLKQYWGGYWILFITFSFSFCFLLLNFRFKEPPVPVFWELLLSKDLSICFFGHCGYISEPVLWFWRTAELWIKELTVRMTGEGFGAVSDTWIVWTIESLFFPLEKWIGVGWIGRLVCHFVLFQKFQVLMNQVLTLFVVSH